MFSDHGKVTELNSNINSKLAVVTGGTRGIGLACAADLANLGYNVIIVGRDAKKGKEAARSIGPRVEFIGADLSLLSGHKRLADEILGRNIPLKILIHSADVLSTVRSDTSEGLEIAFAVSYLSRVALNDLLLPALQAAAPAGIVHVSSPGFPGKLNMEQIPPTDEAASLAAHATANHANEVYGLGTVGELAGTGVQLSLINPGVVNTDIRRRAVSGALGLLIRTVDILVWPFAKSPKIVSKLVLRLATEPLAQENGLPVVLYNAKGKSVTPKNEHVDPDVQMQLIEKSRDLIKRTMDNGTFGT